MNRRIRKKVKNTCMAVCEDIAYGKGMSVRSRHRLRVYLNLWSKINDVQYTYGYTGSPMDHIGYCSDRMNAGRARAILRLLNKEDSANV